MVCSRGPTPDFLPPIPFTPAYHVVASPFHYLSLPRTLSQLSLFSLSLLILPNPATHNPHLHTPKEALRRQHHNHHPREDLLSLSRLGEAPEHPEDSQPRSGEPWVCELGFGHLPPFHGESQVQLIATIPSFLFCTALGRRSMCEWTPSKMHVLLVEMHT